MADPASIFDQVDEDIEAQAIAEAEADVAAGRVYSHDQVKPWLEKLAQGQFVPFSTKPCE
jgi:predicted transcriptional regulator